MKRRFENPSAVIRYLGTSRSPGPEGQIEAAPQSLQRVKDKVRKPALRLMTDYRLVIEEIKDAEAITSYTWLVDTKQVKGAEKPEVYLTFSPRFEHIWLESKSVSWSMLPRTRLTNKDYNDKQPLSSGSPTNGRDHERRLG
jgi:hypothetical protein